MCDGCEIGPKYSTIHSLIHQHCSGLYWCKDVETKGLMYKTLTHRILADAHFHAKIQIYQT